MTDYIIMTSENEVALDYIYTLEVFNQQTEQVCYINRAQQIMDSTGDQITKEVRTILDSKGLTFQAKYIDHIDEMIDWFDKDIYIVNRMLPPTASTK